jgi:GT2 family glycosyltransferase
VVPDEGEGDLNRALAAAARRVARADHGTAAMLADRAGRDPFDLVVLRQPANGGPAKARNRGWRASRGQVVCFTDDDCVPQRDWLARLVAACDGDTIAQGRTIPRPDQHWGPFSLTVERRCEDGFYETCNIAYPRALLERTDGFDETFRFPYGEDTDLAWRVRATGAGTRFVDDALVHHEVWPFSWSRHVRDVRRREGLALLVAKHPDLRELFPGRWYQRATHPAAVVVAGALAALAARPRSLVRAGAAAAAIGAYYRACRVNRRNPPRRRDWPRVLPAMLATDLAEATVLGVASARRGSFFI